LDFNNAFNSVRRDFMLEAVASRAPSIFNFADWLMPLPLS
jgi:hypothetical protein